MNKSRVLTIGIALACLLPWMLGSDEPNTQENQSRLSEMTPEQLEQLTRKRHSFELLSPNERDKLRRLDREIHSQPNADQLMQTLRGYHDWLSTLSSQEQAQLKDENPVTRIDKIREQIAQRRQNDIGLTPETRLPISDHEALRKWANDLAAKRQSEIARLRPQDRDRGDGINRRGPQIQIARLVFAVNLDNTSDEQLLTLVSEEDLDKLAQSISSRGREILEDQQTHREKVRLVFRWIMASFMTRVSDEELRRFSDEVLTDQERENIYRLGPDDGRQELIRQYNRHRMRRMSPRPQNPPGGFLGLPRQD